jgi:hypothetical protein
MRATTLARSFRRIDRLEVGSVGASSGGDAVLSGERTRLSWRWGRFTIGAAVTGVVARPRWGLLLAASVLLLLAIPGVGTATAAVTIDTTNHTVTTSKLAIQFGNATTNIPDNPERIDSLKWTGSSGVQTANLAASGGSSCGDGREWWGESYGTVIGQPPFLVAGGSTGTWSSPTANEVQIQSQSSSDPTCFTTRPQIPITTTYTFYDSGPGVNEIRVERRVPFDTHPLSSPGGVGLRVYVPRLPIGVYDRLLYPDADGNVASASVCDDCAPVGSDVWGGGWFADNSSATNSGLLVLRDQSDQPGAGLEPDRDDISAANDTSIIVPQPTGGWTTAVDEVEYLCFYDTTTWPLSDRQSGQPATLPTGCGPVSATGAPTVTGESALAVGQTSATVSALVNPNGAATRYHVEWGPTTSYGSRGPALPSGAPLTGQGNQAVAGQLTGLSPATTYHWRIVAANADGTAFGADETVRTSGGGGSGEPTARFTITPVSGTGARTIVSAGASSGNGSPIVSYRWDWTGSGSYSSGCSGHDAVAVPVYTRPGTYRVGLEVTAADGQSSTTSGTIAVSHVPTGLPSNGSVLHGYDCGSLVGNSLCMHHIEWDLIVADALDNGCFEEVTVKPLPGFAVQCALPCTSGGRAVLPPRSTPPFKPPCASPCPSGGVTFTPRQTDGAIRKSNAKTWEATGRVLVNGVIIAPQKHYVVVGTQQVGGFRVPRFEELPPAVLIDEYTDTIYDASADVFVRGRPPLPDTMLARDQTVFKSLPVSASTPPALAATAHRGLSPVAHGADAPDAQATCQDPRIQQLPTLASLPDPQGLPNSSIDGFPLGDDSHDPGGNGVTVHVFNGHVIVCVDITLPALTPCSPDSHGFVLRATLAADQSGLELQSLHADLPCAIIAGVVFQNVSFDYDSSGHHWSASGDVQAIPGIDLHGQIEFEGGAFKDAHAQLDTPSLVSLPFQLHDVSIEVTPDQTTGNVGVRLYPDIPEVGSPLELDGDYELNWRAGYFRVGAAASTFGIPFGKAVLTAYDNGDVTGKGTLDGDLAGVIRAHADLEFDFWHAVKLRFDAEAHATISVLDLVNVDGHLLVSDRGAAACAQIGVDLGILGDWEVSLGGALDWPVSWHPIFAGCDIGEERDAAPTAGGARAHDALAGFAVPVARGTRYEVVGVSGDTAPPAVVLSGPGGEQLIVPSDHPVLGRRYLVLHDPTTKATFVILRAPAAGRWTLSPQPGSASITGVHFATSLPPVSVKARVAGTGRRRRLTYSITRIPGQTVRFLERGAKSLSMIGQVNTGGRGTIRFAPASGPRGTRHIVAIVEQYGRPRTELTVASYVAPGPRRLVRPRRLRAARTGASLKLTWRPVAGAWAYAITIRTSDGRAISTVVPTPRFTLLGVASTTTARAAVRSLDAHQRGPWASISIRAAMHPRGAHRGGPHGHH